MPRYAAFLRGVSPQNCKMPELKRCLEEAGFSDVQTVISSGNAVFTARSGTEAALERKIESATQACLGQEFKTIVRSVKRLEALLASDPYPDLEPGAKRVVTFLKQPPATEPDLPAPLGGARIVKVDGTEVFTVYLPDPGNPAFMVLLEKTFGRDITTRTWETIHKVVTKSRG